MLCFGYLCTNVFVLNFMFLGGGGWSPACGGMGALLTGFYGFLRVVPLRGATSVI